MDDIRTGEKYSKRKRFGCCCSQIGQLAIGKEALQLTELEMEVGIGLTMYFRQIKLMMIIFLIMTMFSVPLMYYNYQAYEYADEGELGLVDYLKDRLLFRFSIATLGLMDFHCQEIKLFNLTENIYREPVILEAASAGKPAVYEWPVNKTDFNINC